MFRLLIASFLIGAVLCAPADVNQKEIAILKNEIEVSPDGSYQYAYETENGIHGEERGEVKEISKEESAKTATGGFGWTSPEGEKVEISYVADENGYQPSGQGLPTPPPIPPQIVKALEWIEAHPEPEEPGRKP